MAQTTQSLRPKVSVFGSLQSGANQEVSRNILLIGRTTVTSAPVFGSDFGTFSEGDTVPYNTPLNLGSVTGKSTGKQLSDLLGLASVFSQNTKLDLSATDELASMIISAGMQYEQYTPSEPRYRLLPCNITVVLIDGASDKTTDPFGASGIALTNLSASRTPIDVFVCPYEFDNADVTTTGNYYEQMKNFLEGRFNDGKRDVGQNQALLFDITTEPSAFGGLVGGFDTLSIFNLPVDSSTSTFFDVATAGAMQAVHLCGMQEPFLGRSGESLPLFPVSVDPAKIISDDNVNTALQCGHSPLPTLNGTVRQNRIVTSNLLDLTTGLPRDTLLDYQDFKGFLVNMIRLWSRIKTGGVINSRFNVSPNGTAKVLEKVKNIAFSLDTQMYESGLIAESPRNYSDQYEVFLDKNNLNLIRVIKPYYSSTIIFQVEADVVAKNFTQLLDSFVISF